MKIDRLRTIDQTKLINSKEGEKMSENSNSGEKIAIHTPSAQLSSSAVSTEKSKAGKSPSKFKQFFWGDKKAKIRVVSIVLPAVLLIALVASVYVRYFKNESNLPNEPKSNILQTITRPKVKKVASPLSGIEYNEDIATRHPLGVVVENHSDARPQSGLSRAEIVYEAIAEGGITRFMAIFGPREAQEIGPVRSARTFFLDWIQEYDGYFAYAGGSKDGLAQIISDNVKSLPHTQGYFERKSRGNVASEHTLFTSTKDLYNLAEKKGFGKTANFTTLNFKDDAKLEDRGDQEKITINFSTNVYQVDWLYDKEQNIYKRVLAGASHKDDKTGEQLTAKNIIIQKVDHRYITFPEDPTAKGVWRFTDIGQGEAWVIYDGKMQKATWKKSSVKDRTRLFDSSGDEIKFNRGVFWYEIIHPDITFNESKVVDTNPDKN
ncbi:MAG: hypothetical protein CEN89_583 [Candidatus Berkelbacteria bacterium Licking1014_7]|uniref:DUF3048 domain-containing protein n=1 Tax=Candidatus Berkelbacteria bacterium Licking1014_7 TaxID=2017147 RepID=A0A554LIF5_9BACT|nr:MAG: hypothetical protein CEN89_583 [Candidatus Berkelbacteria bacterium Licking1014_7]